MKLNKRLFIILLAVFILLGALVSSCSKSIHTAPEGSNAIDTVHIGRIIGSTMGGMFRESRIGALAAPEMALSPPLAEGRDQFATISDNPVKVTQEEPVSTFSIDVDTAAYAFVRRQLNRGVLPQKNAVRVEELINYFDYNYPLPKDKNQPFLPTVTIYPNPWNAKTKLLHIGIQGYPIDKLAKPKANLVFLIDTSGSMASADKLPLLIQSFRLLVEHLTAEDRIAIVTYAGSAGVVLESTAGNEKLKINSALERLNAGGSTAGGEGIRLAYALAEQQFDKAAVNRVILATDGDFNVGISNTEELKSFIERKRETGIFLSVLGFGQGNYNDELMQVLAQNGNGTAAYIDTLNEARKVLVEEASSTLFPIAKDVKIQLEFNPNRVSEYRLIGYENRLLKREDFNNDQVDAGEIGASHRVTAIYEIALVGDGGERMEPLRYQSVTTAENAILDEFGFLKMRYKLPNAEQSRLITVPIDQRLVKSNVDQVTNDIRFATAVAAFGQILRGGTYTGAFAYEAVIALAQQGKGEDEFGYRAEFINLVHLAKTARAME